VKKRIVRKKVREAEGTNVAASKAVDTAGGMEKKIGRPPKPQSQLKEDFVRVMLTGAQKALLAKAAQTTGSDLGSWVRAVALERARAILGTTTESGLSG